MIETGNTVKVIKIIAESSKELEYNKKFIGKIGRVVSVTTHRKSKWPYDVLIENEIVCFSDKEIEIWG